MKVLVTGFEPFGGDVVNPSALLAQGLAGRLAGGVVVHEILPCAFAPLQGRLRAVVGVHRPDVVVAFGLATGREGISLERVAINVIDARIADNEGVAPVDEPVVAGGPAAYFSSLPIKAAMMAVREAGIVAAVSQTAGTFACNAAFYGLMHLAATEFPGMRAGFVHVPALPEMAAGGPYLPLAQQIEAGRLVIEACLECHTDRRIGAGAVA